VKASKLGAAESMQRKVTMLTVRKANDRGRTQIDWLDSYHSFSFGDYFDPGNMGFGPLRVINEDVVAPGGGFGTHPHKDMEIITYVIDGALQHRDSLGTGSVIKPGEIQKMSAGSGILHSEFNASKEKPVHLLQIWIVPDKRSIEPKYEQEKFELKPGELTLLGSSDGNAPITIHQNVKLYALSAERGTTVTHTAAPKANVWLQVVKGQIKVNGKDLGAGDGAALTAPKQLELSTDDAAEVLLFEMLGS
jgi:redox-sensitive bicupin YhaK (pirin superfamily)